MFLGGCPCCGKKECWRCYRKPKDCADYEPPNSVSFNLSLGGNVRLDSKTCSATPDDQFPSPGPTSQCPTDQDYLNLWNTENESFSSSSFFKSPDNNFFLDYFDDTKCDGSPSVRCFPEGHEHRIEYSCSSDTFNYYITRGYGKGPNFPGLGFRDSFDPYNDGSFYEMTYPPASECISTFAFTAKIEHLLPFLEGEPITQDNCISSSFDQSGLCNAVYGGYGTVIGAEYRLVNPTEYTFSVVCT